MSPRDISYNLNKKEGDVVRRLKKMEKCGLVKSQWGSRLGQSVKLYSLTTHDIGIKVDQDGIELKFTKKEKGGNIDSTKAKAKEAQRSIIRPRPVGSNEFFVPLEKEQLGTIVGRNEELEVLRDRTTNFFFIVGIAGIGKTTLVKKFLAESTTTVAKNNIKVFWHTFREIDAVAFLLGKISGYLSANNIQDLSLHLDNRTSNTFSMNNDRVSTLLYDSSSLDIAADALNKLGDCVLVFDDYQKVKDENISVFLKHLKQNFKGKLIIISRSRPPFFLDSVSSKEMVLAGLSFNDALKMVTDFQATLDEEVLRGMWKKFGGHPMALKILCLLIATKKREGPEDNRKKEKDFTYAQIPSMENLRLYFQREILEMLDEDELDTLLTLSIFRNPVRAQALKRKSSGGGKSSNKAGGRKSLDYLLHLLEKKLLINRTSNHEFYLHDMLKDILYSMLAYPEEAHSSAAQYYMSEGRVDSIIEALYHLTKSHSLSRIFEILEEEVVNERYRFIEEGYATSLVDILGQLSIPKSVNNNKLVYLYAIQGKALSMLEKWGEANERLEKTIKIAKFYSTYSSDNTSSNTNDLLVAHSLRVVSESYYLQGDFIAVEKYLLQAAAMFQKSKNMEKVLHDIYMKIARLYFATGRNEESKSYSEMASSLMVHESFKKS